MCVHWWNEHSHRPADSGAKIFLQPHPINRTVLGSCPWRTVCGHGRPHTSATEGTGACSPRAAAQCRQTPSVPRTYLRSWRRGRWSRWKSTGSPSTFQRACWVVAQHLPARLLVKMEPVGSSGGAGQFWYELVLEPPRGGRCSNRRLARSYSISHKKAPRGAPFSLQTDQKICRWIMVSLRSGPVEMISIGAPTSSSIRAM